MQNSPWIVQWKCLIYDMIVPRSLYDIVFKYHCPKINNCSHFIVINSSWVVHHCDSHRGSPDPQLAVQAYDMFNVIHNNMKYDGCHAKNRIWGCYMAVNMSHYLIAQFIYCDNGHILGQIHSPLTIKHKNDRKLLQSGILAYK